MAAKDHGDLTLDFLASHGSTQRFKETPLPTSVLTFSEHVSQAMTTIQIAGWLNHARLDLMGLGSWPNPGPQNGLLPTLSIPLIPGIEQFSSFPQSYPFSDVRLSGNSFQETTSCTLINSPPRKIHFPLQSWQNPMRILYWRIKSINGNTRWLEHFHTKSREEVTTPPKTTPNCLRRSPQEPQNLGEKTCVFRKIHHAINFWEDIYMYICVYISAYGHTYSVHAMRQNHSDFSIGATQVWPCLKQMESTQAVNPGSSGQWQDLCLSCSLCGFDQMALMWFELWKSSQSLESLLLHSPATWNHWVENASSSNPLTLTTFRAISANNFLRHGFSL